MAKTLTSEMSMFGSSCFCRSEICYQRKSDSYDVFLDIMVLRAELYIV